MPSFRLSMPDVRNNGAEFDVRVLFDESDERIPCADATILVVGLSVLYELDLLKTWADWLVKSVPSLFIRNWTWRFCESSSIGVSHATVRVG